MIMLQIRQAMLQLYINDQLVINDNDSRPGKQFCYVAQNSDIEFINVQPHNSM